MPCPSAPAPATSDVCMVSSPSDTMVSPQRHDGPRAQRDYLATRSLGQQPVSYHAPQYGHLAGGRPLLFTSVCPQNKPQLPPPSPTSLKLPPHSETFKLIPPFQPTALPQNPSKVYVQIFALIHDLHVPQDLPAPPSLPYGLSAPHPLPAQRMV